MNRTLSFRRMRFASALLFAGVLQPFTSTLSADEPATSVEVGQCELSTGDTVVFLGDSITHQRLYTQYIEDFFITRYPSIQLHFHNSGIGGDQAWDALQRLQRDVLDQSPELVTILLGMNDGRYQPFNREIFDTYQSDMSKLLDRLEEANVTVSPITPTMFDEGAARAELERRPRDEAMMQQYNAVLAYFGTWLQGEAERREMRSIDMFSPLNQLTQDARIETPEFTFIGDAVHPGPAGQLIMAYAWLEDLGQQGPVSTITLTPTAKGYRNRANGGTVSNVSSQDETIEFDFLANSLPWVTPQSTEKAAEMLRLGHRFSKESLQVHGLQPGKYALTIDGTHIGEFSNNQLAAHIELQRFANTPQSQQAANVVAMNAKRNETTIRQLRDHWVAYRNLQRDKRSLENAGDENAKKRFEQRVSEGEQRTEGFEAKLVELEKQADAELAEIYKAAQPQTHHYVLTKVE